MEVAKYVNLIRKVAWRLLRPSRSPFTESYLERYRELYPPSALQQRRFYNVGAGGFSHPYWTNVDKPSGFYAQLQEDQVDVAYDLFDQAPLPIEDESAEIVYTSHTLEHVPDAAARHFFEEAHRVLKPGGVLRVTMPDADLLYRAYRRKDRYFDPMLLMYDTQEKAASIDLDRPAPQLSSQQLFLWRIATSVSVYHQDGSAERMTDEEVDEVFDTYPFAEAMDQITSKCDLDVQKRHPNNHVSWWNWEKLSRELDRAGFDQYEHSGYGQSAAAVLRDTRQFDKKHPVFSLYGEARK